MNEGTYVNNVIVPLINTCLFNNYFEKSIFITTFERQNIAKYFRIICTKQKEKDDDIKLWHECNDRLYWTQKSHRLKKEQFGIIGIQITRCRLSLNVLIRNELEVHQYYKLHETEIPI
ncbi:hypothetical protein Glove_579g34 [Diversispora epigaea]|uniref:Uncharacterized protein n=1 Tax=Diversispora epigaea TaxID=1348612 RepID=A0A397GBL6_9GLOM|nr:hypothetical protein Glove_579g34 [Diversispora epigaea]